MQLDIFLEIFIYPAAATSGAQRGAGERVAPHEHHQQSLIIVFIISACVLTVPVHPRPTPEIFFPDSPPLDYCKGQMFYNSLT